MPEQDKDKEKDYFDFPEKLEGLLYGLGRFGTRFFYTFRDLTLHHARFRQHLAAGTDTGVYVRPRTFLTILTFFMIRTYRTALVILSLSLSTLFRGCDGQTYTEVEYPSVIQTLNIPSLDEILLIGVPMFFGIHLLAWLLKYMLLRGNRSPADDQGFIKFVCYSVGFQYATYFMIILLGLALENANGVFDDVQLDTETEQFLIYGMLIIIGLWPCLIFYRFLSNAYPRESFRVQKKYLRQAYLCFGSIILIGGSVLVGMAMVYPLAQYDLRKYNVELPEISLGFIDYRIETSGTFDITLLARNNTDRKLTLISNEIEYLQGDYAYAGEIRTDTVAPVFTLDPDESRWLSLHFAQARQELVRDMFTNYSDIIQFKDINPDGRRRAVRSKIKTHDANFRLPAAAGGT